METCLHKAIQNSRELMENCPQTKENSVETHVTKYSKNKVIYIILQIGFSFFSPSKRSFYEI